MSNISITNNNGGIVPANPDIEFIKGDDGVNVGPNPTTHIVQLKGDAAQGVSTSGNAVTYTETITVADATEGVNAGAASKGVSSYYSGDFDVTSGFVTLANKATDIGQTVDAATIDLLVLDLGAVPGAFSIEGRAVAFESTTPAGSGFQLFGAARTDGVNAQVIGLFEIISNADAAIDTAEISVTQVGNTVVFQATGVAPFTIDWAAEIQYTFRG